MAQFCGGRLLPMSESGLVERHTNERTWRRELWMGAIMEFMLMSYVQESGWGQLTKEQQKQGMASYMAYTETLAKAGVLKMNRRLARSASTNTVRLKDGRALVLDGPYVEAKEQLGGFFIIDVTDRQVALGWAAKCPTVGHGVVEVREMSGR
jgi:hypothetical protein